MNVLGQGRGFAWAAAFLVASCTTVNWQTKTYVAPDYAGNPRNIHVFYVLPEEEEGKGINPADLAVHVTDALRGCGIASTSAFKNSGRAAASEPGPGPIPEGTDAFLLVQETSRLMVTTMKYQYKPDEMARYYSLKMSPVPERRLVWSADLYSSPSNYGRRNFGPRERTEQLAKDIVRFMAADRVVQGCPSAPRED